MVSQVNWEDDIIWTLDDVKPNLQAQARAGWIPTQTTRTAHAYALQQEQLLQQLGIKKLNFYFPLSRTSWTGLPISFQVDNPKLNVGSNLLFECQVKFHVKTCGKVR